MRAVLIEQTGRIFKIGMLLGFVLMLLGVVLAWKHPGNSGAMAIVAKVVGGLGVVGGTVCALLAWLRHG